MTLAAHVRRVLPVFFFFLIVPERVCCVVPSVSLVVGVEVAPPTDTVSPARYDGNAFTLLFEWKNALITRMISVMTFSKVTTEGQGLDENQDLLFGPLEKVTAPTKKSKQREPRGVCETETKSTRHQLKKNLKTSLHVNQ